MIYTISSLGGGADEPPPPSSPDLGPKIGLCGSLELVLAYRNATVSINHYKSIYKDL